MTGAIFFQWDYNLVGRLIEVKSYTYRGFLKKLAIFTDLTGQKQVRIGPKPENLRITEAIFIFG